MIFFCRERREAEQRERERQAEKERLQQEKERRERAERERIERERERQNREKQISAVDAVDHHFQLSMELAKKVSDLLQCQMFEHIFQGDSPREL